jgi:hypothetical protein
MTRLAPRTLTNAPCFLPASLLSAAIPAFSCAPHRTFMHLRLCFMCISLSLPHPLLCSISRRTSKCPRTPCCTRMNEKAARLCALISISLHDGSVRDLNVRTSASEPSWFRHPPGRSRKRPNELRDKRRPRFAFVSISSPDASHGPRQTLSSARAVIDAGAATESRPQGQRSRGRWRRAILANLWVTRHDGSQEQRSLREHGSGPLESTG